MARPLALVVLLVAIAASAQAAPAAEPSADFTVEPAVPTAGERATYRAVLSEEYGNGNVQWDFNADGAFEEKGREVKRAFRAPGDRQVTMRLMRGGQVRVTVTKTVVVAPRPPGAPPPPEPEPEPEPEPGPEVPAPPTLPEDPSAPPPRVDLPQAPRQGAAPELMTPFPVVRIAGLLLPWGARVRLLTVRASEGATVTVRCNGVGCPLRPVRRRAGNRVVRIRSLERRLRAGARVEVFVREDDLIGKYTRFRIRGRGRALKRLDRCLLPGSTQPVRCPSN